MEPDSPPNGSPAEEQSVGQFTFFHVLAICCAMVGAASGSMVGRGYGIVGVIIGVVVGAPFGYYTGFYGVVIFLFGLLSLIYPRDPDLGIISILKSGWSKIKRRKKN